MNHLQGMIGELNLKIQNEVFCVYQLRIYVPIAAQKFVPVKI